MLIDRENQKLALAVEVPARRFRGLIGSGEVDEAVGEIELGAAVDAGRDGGVPILLRQNFVNAGQSCAPRGSPMNSQRGGSPGFRGGS